MEGQRRVLRPLVGTLAAVVRLVRLVSVLRRLPILQTLLARLEERQKTARVLQAQLV
jgi:hypothetical protein